MLYSDYRRLCVVDLPYLGRQKYMHTFDLANPVMASGFEDYLEPVKALCATAGATTGLAHMTVDEKIIEPGQSQRRPGPHVDGCFIPSAGSWDHQGGGGWRHTCNNIGLSEVHRMPVIVASTYQGCKVWKGLFYGQPKNDGDLSHIASQLGRGEVLEAGHGYLLSADCVHESMLMQKRTTRTFLRIALPTDFRF